MKCFKYSICLVATLMLLACHRNNGGGGDLLPSDDHSTTITLSMMGGVTKSRLDPSGENSVQRACVFVFDRASGAVNVVFAKEIFELQSGNKAFTVPLPRSKTIDHKFDLLVVANSPLTVTQLQGVSVKLNGKYAGRNAWIAFDSVVVATATSGIDVREGILPMTGLAQELYLGKEASDNILVDMIRSVASVDVGVGYKEGVWEGLPDFVFRDVYVFNANMTYRLVPNPTNINAEHTVTLPTLLRDAKRKKEPESGTDAPVGSHALVSALYVSEADKNEAAQLQTAIVVGGDYKGTKSYYRLDFKDDQGKPDYVLRNYKYRFNITKIIGPGYPTALEAFNSKSIAVDYTVQAWELKEFVYSAVDGGYILGLDKRALGFDQFGGTQSVSILATGAKPLFDKHWADSTKVSETVTLYKRVVQPGDDAGAFSFTLTDLGANKYRMDVQCVAATADQLIAIKDTARFAVKNLHSNIAFSRSGYDIRRLHTVPSYDTLIQFEGVGKSFPIEIKSASKWGLVIDSEAFSDMVDGLYLSDANGDITSERVALQGGNYLDLGAHGNVKYWIKFKDMALFGPPRTTMVKISNSYGTRAYLAYVQSVPYIKFEHNSVNLSESEHKDQVVLLQTNQMWTLSSDHPDVLTVLGPATDRYDRVVRYDLKPNLTFSERKIVLTAKTPDGMQAFYEITQKGILPTLSVSPSSLAVPNTMTTNRIKITSNIAWRVSVPKGSSFISTGITAGRGDEFFTLSVAANTTFVSRDGEVKVEPMDDATLTTEQKAALTQSIIVTQAARAATLTVSPG